MFSKKSLKFMNNIIKSYLTVKFQKSRSPTSELNTGQGQIKGSLVRLTRPKSVALWVLYSWFFNNQSSFFVIEVDSKPFTSRASQYRTKNAIYEPSLFMENDWYQPLQFVWVRWTRNNRPISSCSTCLFSNLLTNIDSIFKTWDYIQSSTIN